MRYRNNLWSALMASVYALLLYACTGGYDDIEILNNGAQGSTDSRAATPVTASVALTETSRLGTQLAAALGSDAQTVQELTISGIFYAEDVEYLHTLKALEKLDMTNATMQHNEEHHNYEFSYSYTDFYGNIVEGHVNNYFEPNVINPEMFTGMTSLKECKIPVTINHIRWSAFRGCTSLEIISIPDNVERIENYAFGDCYSLHTLTIPKTVTQIEDGFASNCTALYSLIWDTTQPVPGAQPNDNCFLYINSSNGVAATYDANNWSCAIVDGVAENIRLNFSANKSTLFHCPIAFTAKHISLTMNFYEIWTYEGKASGWRTLTLPFNVTSITSEEKGTLAPFGSSVAGAKPFWLRQLTANGFVDVTSIEADQPYIIAMPYNPNLYLDEYNISGNVVFEGENVSIPVTPDELPAVEGPDYYLQPTYRFVGKDRTVYALNYNYYIRGYERGGVFAHTSTPVYAYEAYVKEKPGSTTRAYYGIDTRSSQTRNVQQKNTSGIPAVGDM